MGLVENVGMGFFQFGDGFVKGFKGASDVGVGVGEAEAGLFGGDGNLINAALDEREAKGFVGDHVVARGDVPPVLRESIHEVDTARAAETRDLGAQAVAAENLLLAVLELRAHVLEF